MTPIVIITGALVLIGVAGIAAVVSRYRWDRDVNAVRDAVDRMAPYSPDGAGSAVITISAAAELRIDRTALILRKLAAKGELVVVSGRYRKPKTGASK